MRFASVLGWITTRLILGLFFFLVLTPVGLLMRLLGKDVLGEKLDPTTDSYWKKVEDAEDPQMMERQF